MEIIEKKQLNFKSIIYFSSNPFFKNKVEHLTHNSKIKGSNPVNVGRELLSAGR